jgi:hypothetical protein
MSPIEDDDLIEASPPSAPLNLEVTEVLATSATLKWKEPKKDGGAPIKEYLIEYKGAKDEEWQEGPKVPTKKFLTDPVPDLTTNVKYQFRVSYDKDKCKDNNWLTKLIYFRCLPSTGLVWANAPMPRSPSWSRPPRLLQPLTGQPFLKARLPARSPSKWFWRYL